MKKKSNITVRRCEIVSRLRDDSGADIIKTEGLEKVLADRQCITDYAYIIHDKDSYTAQDEKNNLLHIAGTLKEPHIHLCMRFNAPQHPENIAKWFGISANFVQKINGRWEDALLYLTHQNTPEKYQYPLSDVTANFDIQKIFDEDVSKRHLEIVIGQILNGEIAEYNIVLKVNPKLLVEYDAKISTAFKVRSEILAATTAYRRVECIYIWGASELGKSTLARKIAESRGLAYFVSSGSNDILDGYRQQPCLILDELKQECMPLGDLLKTLDNNMRSSVRSRYHNKFPAYELVIITTSLSLEQFFDGIRKADSESIVQLKRRCGTYIEVRPDRLYVSRWDQKRRAYSDPVEYVNDIIAEYTAEEEVSDEDIEAFISKFIPFISKPEPQERRDGFEQINGNEQLALPFMKEVL